MPNRVLQAIAWYHSVIDTYEQAEPNLGIRAEMKDRYFDQIENNQMLIGKTQCTQLSVQRLRELLIHGWVR